MVAPDQLGYGATTGWDGDYDGDLASFRMLNLARDTVKWSTLSLLRGRFVDDDWRRNETDMLYSVEREGTEPAVLVYVLLEHQSTPDRWLRLRLLGYCVQVWQQWRRQHASEERLPLWCRWYSRRLSDPTSSERGPLGEKRR